MLPGKLTVMDRVPVEAPPENMEPANPLMPAPSEPASGHTVVVVKRSLPSPATRSSSSRSGSGMETSAKMSAMGSGARNLNWDRILLIYLLFLVRHGLLCHPNQIYRTFI